MSYTGWLTDAVRMFAAGHDLTDPLISPIRADVSGFPPVMLTCGTRDLFLSSTVRMHRKLREAGVPADLIVIEGASHMQYAMLPDAPETAYHFRELGRFFDTWLGRCSHFKRTSSAPRVKGAVQADGQRRGGIFPCRKLFSSSGFRALPRAAAPSCSVEAESSR